MKRRERERVRLQVLLGQVLLGQVRTERHQYSHTSTTFVRGISFVNKGRLRFFQASVLLCILDLYTGRHISVVIRYIFGYFLTTMFIYTHPYNIYSITRRHRLHPLFSKKTFTPTPFLNEAVQTQPPPPPPQERKELSLSLTQFLARENDTPPC